MAATVTPPAGGMRSRRHRELREFLMTRRARVSPAEAGLPDGGARRRTPGLRREEVAVLEGVVRAAGGAGAGVVSGAG